MHFKQNVSSDFPGLGSREGVRKGKEKREAAGGGEGGLGVRWEVGTI